jgi:hypothetical protein
MPKFERITEEQVKDFALGKVVELNAAQLTTIVRYMAKGTPIAIINVGDRCYRAVSVRRLPHGDDLTQELLGVHAEKVEDNTGEIRIALDHMVKGR